MAFVLIGMVVFNGNVRKIDIFLVLFPERKQLFFVCFILVCPAFLPVRSSLKASASAGPCFTQHRRCSQGNRSLWLVHMEEMSLKYPKRVTPWPTIRRMGLKMYLLPLMPSLQWPTPVNSGWWPSLRLLAPGGEPWLPAAKCSYLPFRTGQCQEHTGVRNDIRNGGKEKQK